MNEIERLELRISRFLRAGVIFAGLLMVVGTTINFKYSGNPFFNFESYDPIPLEDLLKAHLKNRNWGALFSYLGLVTLISLPLIRVLLTAVLFFRQKDYLLSSIAALVLLGLVLSFTLGIEL